jgi:Tol biopolymer transport system component
MNPDAPVTRITFCPRRRILLLPVIILIASLLSACGQVFPPAATPTPELASTAGQILFYSDRDGIYIVNRSGEGLRHLTDKNVRWAVWAPDGKQIAYLASASDNCCEIFVMRADGQDKVQLTESHGDIEDLSWSPNGKYIAYGRRTNDSGPGLYMPDLYVMNADGSDQQLLAGFAAIPRWSPDSEHIAFVTVEHHQPHRIVLTRRDGSDAKVAYPSVSIPCEGERCPYDDDPVWSPDGKLIAFVSNRDGNDEIYVMNADGSNQRRLTDTPSSDSEPNWSPDGKYIAFDSNRDGNTEIYVMNADGSNQRRLTNDTIDNFQPDWSPDGKNIAFVSNRDGNREIYVMNADGSNQTRLTNNTVSDYDPVWSPQLENK